MRRQNYENITNFGPLRCPHCHSNNLIRWGFYERSVIFFSDKRNNILESNIVKIQRIRCKGCGKTHAILPFGIVPYKQFSDEVLSRFLFESTFNRLEYIADKYSVNEGIIDKCIKQFKKYHLSKVSIITKSHDLKDMMKVFFKNHNNKLEYIKQYNLVFMQIKKGCIGLCPS